MHEILQCRRLRFVFWCFGFRKLWFWWFEFINEEEKCVEIAQYMWFDLRYRKNIRLEGNRRSLQYRGLKRKILLGTMLWVFWIQSGDADVLEHYIAPLSRVSEKSRGTIFSSCLTLIKRQLLEHRKERKKKVKSLEAPLCV